MSFQPTSDNSLNPRVLKLDSDHPSNYLLRGAKFGHRIKPILLLNKIEYKGDPQMICRLSVKGYKYISKMSTSGEFTVEILKKISKVSCIKQIRSLDFDPYLCITSGLKSLSRVLMKMNKLISRLYLVFRRFDEKDELKKVSECLGRLSQISKLKVEFTNPRGMDKQDLGDFVKYSRNFNRLKNAEMTFVDIKDLSHIRGMFKNSYNIERWRLHMYFPQTKPGPEQTDENRDKIERKNENKQGNQRTRFAKNLKSFDIKFAFKSGWVSYFDGVDIGQGFQIFLRGLPNISNPVNFYLTFDKLQMPLDVMKEYANVLTKLPNLRFVYLELSNTKMAELEFLTLVKGFVDCKQIEHVTFKYLDKAIIPFADLLPFITILSKFSVFPKFDLFFRKIYFQEWQAPESRRKLDELKNIKYVLTKQSIHIQKILPIEE